MASKAQTENFIEEQTEFYNQNSFQIQKTVDDQRYNESIIIEETQSFCPFDKLEDKTIRGEQVEKALKDGYGDGNILKSVMCLNNSIVSFPPSSGVKRNFKVRNYLQDLTQIGSESAEGYAMLADVDNEKGEKKKNLFVVKSSRKIDPSLDSDQIHEYFIGAFGTNTLRSLIPNFAFMLGLFKCSPPYIDNSSYLGGTTENQRKSLTFCQNDTFGNDVNYLIYENVADSVTLREFIESGKSFNEFLNVFTQVVLALDLAYENLDFTHYDLHTENVLVRELPEEIYIPYKIDNQTKYLRTKYVATIIDFGRSHIKYNNKHYGYAFPEYGIYPDRSYPMYDIYKLLMFSLSDAAFGDNDSREYLGYYDNELEGYLTNPEILNRGKEMLKYFNPGLMRDEKTGELTGSVNYLAETIGLFYTMPYYQQYDQRPYSFYEKVLEKVYPNFIQKFVTNIKPKDRKIYGCENKGVCKTLEEAIGDYSIEDKDLISDPYVFYNTLISFSDIEEARSYGLMGQDYAKINIRKLMQDGEDYFNGLLRLGPDQQILSLSQANNVSTEFLEPYREYVARVIKMVDLMTSIKYIQEVLTGFITVYRGYGIDESVILNNFKRYDETVPALNEKIRNLKLDVAYINNLNKEEVLNYNRSAKWLFQKMPTLDSAIVEFEQSS